MALLTADDVHWKQFATTKFREGYDQVEVDEFLDQVVETIATLSTENTSLKSQLDEVRVAAANGEAIVLPDANSAELEELRGQLAAANNQLAEANAQIDQLKNAGSVATPVEGEVNAQHLADLEQALSVAQAAQAQAESAAEAAQAEAEQLRSDLAKAQSAPSAPSGSEDAASMLALAQRVHDEYVKNGQDQADDIVSKAKSEGEQIIKDAKDERDRVIAQLEEERSTLEGKVSELKTFEAEYCAQLREHLNGLLQQVSDGQ